MSIYKITNPYERVSLLLKDPANHYKTNLHTHSSYSDANNTMTQMIEAFYDHDFDILAFAEHGIFGKEWNKEPTIIPLYLFQNIWHGKRHYLNDRQYNDILEGTYKTENNTRTKKRGLMCVPHAIEANMWTLVKNHVNGYFTDDACEGIFGKENDYETPIMKIEKSGGISHINHPTDWLRAYKYPDSAREKEHINFFADLFKRYRSCVGMEVLNMYDKTNRSDRILWDELLQVILPQKERTIFGFANSDAHRITEIDTAFMDFILPEFSLDILRNAMETGTFFAVARYAKNELGEDFAGTGAYPQVTDITVDADNDTITIRGVNCHTIEWIANGDIIQADTFSENEGFSTIQLEKYQDKISCYVRAQLKGRGGICMTQPFICDDGNMERFKAEIPEKPVYTGFEKIKHDFFNTRIGVILSRTLFDKQKT